MRVCPEEVKRQSKQKKSELKTFSAQYKELYKSVHPPEPIANAKGKGKGKRAKGRGGGHAGAAPAERRLEPGELSQPQVKATTPIDVVLRFIGAV